jgi:ABC-2 type transport system permease protein
VRNVSFRCLRPVMKKEFRQIRRDVPSLIFLIFIPVFMLLLFGYALNFDVKHIPLAVLDEDGSASSRELIDKFRMTESFDLVAFLTRHEEIDDLMGREVIHAALVIPGRFSEDILAERDPTVQVIVDGTNAMSGTTAAGYVAAIVQSYSQAIALRAFERRGLGAPAVPLEAEIRVWYNPELRSAKFLVPGLMAFILMVIVTISTAFSVVREKERGTMEQIMVSPIRPVEFVVGKMVPYVVISLLSAHLVLLAGSALFGVTIQGSYPLLLLTMSLFLVCGLGQGILISTVTGTQQVAFMISLLSTFLPTFVLSGFVFPVRNMPDVVQAVTYLVPAKYFLVALRAIILKGAGLRAFWGQLLFLSGFAALTLGLSTARLRKSEKGSRKRGRAR